MQIDNIQNFQYFQNAYGFNHGSNGNSDVNSSSSVVSGRFAALTSKETFGTFTPEKTAKTEKSEYLAAQGTRPKFLELLSGLGEVHAISSQSAIESVAKNTANPYLSNFRGEMGQNMPLGSAAIYQNGGFSGAKLNVIA